MITIQEIQQRIVLDGIASAAQHYQDALHRGDLKPEDFSVRDLAVCFMPGGITQIEQMETLSPGVATHFVTMLTAVVTAKIKEGYHHEDFAFSKILPTLPTGLDGERLYPFGVASDADLAVTAGTYTTAQLAQYIDTPSTVYPANGKGSLSEYGLTLPITKELIVLDKTSQLLFHAYKVGEAFGNNKENCILDVMLGIVNSFRRTGTPRITYYSGGSSHPWRNLFQGNELLSLQNVENAKALFLEDEKPEPIAPPNPSITYFDKPSPMDCYDVLVMPPKYSLARGLLANSPKYRLLSSLRAYQRLQLQGGLNLEKIWFIGDFGKAFAWMEHRSLTVVSAGNATTNIAMEFNVSEFGCAAVIRPRYSVKGVA